MNIAKKNIIDGLKKDLLVMQGISQASPNNLVDKAIGEMKFAFPNHSFPVSAVHEFIAEKNDAAATMGFVGVLLAALMNSKGVAIWISAKHSVFPPALQGLGITPDNVLFIYLRDDRQIVWAMEEALKCKGLAAVIGEIKDLNFTTSRRLQLSIEKSLVTGIVLRSNTGRLQTNACVSRWRVKPMPSALPGRMPGVGFPRWEVELLKIRNGHPGKWNIEFRGGRIRYINPSTTVLLEQKKEAV